MSVMHQAIDIIFLMINTASLQLRAKLLFGLLVTCGPDKEIVRHGGSWVCGNHLDGLVQERRNSSALAVELRLSCINPSICVSVVTL